MSIYGLISAFTDWLWGIPILILLVTGGFILTLQIQGIQFTKIGFILKNTVGTLFDKELQRKKKAAGISPVQALTAALGATVGTGNIVGVGVAIATGGPGALFWMWVCGFLAMAIKYSEVTMSIKYRHREADGSYRGGPFMYMRDGLHCMPLAVAFGIMMLQVFCKPLCSSSSLIDCIGTVSIQTYGRKNGCIAGRVEWSFIYCSPVFPCSGIMSRHIDVYSAFVQKDQMIYVSLRHMFFPVSAFFPDIGDAPALRHEEIFSCKNTRV